MSNSHELIRRREAVVPAAVARFAGPATAVSARGAIIVDADGRELIDFAGGIGVMNVGHSHPDVVRAIQAQAARLQHACIHVATYEPYVALCERLVGLFPHGDGGTKAMLVNSGAEAVENAIKIARQATGRPAVIAFTESFHGRTLLATTLTSKVGYKAGCGPFAPEVYRLPYPNRFRDGGGDEAAYVRRALDDLRRALLSTVRPEDVAAIILEVVQGEGGFVVAPRAWLHGVRRLCDEHGICLVFDEVQSGFGRTGRWAAYEHFDVTPDLSTWAKSMGGGLPISAVVGRAAVMDRARPGTCGGTYGGNPVACAAALAAIDVIEREDLGGRAEAIGRRIRERFESIRAACPSVVADLRGLGAMQAMELAHGGDPSRPATDVVRAVVLGCLEQGVIVVSAGTAGNVVRLLCPLVITDEQLERGLDILEAQILEHAGAVSAAAAG